MAKKGVKSVLSVVRETLNTPRTKEARPDGGMYYVYSQEAITGAIEQIDNIDWRETKPDPSKRNKRNAGKRVGNKAAKRARG